MPRPPLTGLATKVERTKSTWGCTIYRTTYSPLSEAHFDKIIRLTTSLIKHNIYEDHDHTNEEERKAYVSLSEFYQPIIMNDKAQFDGMTVHGAMEHYRTYLEIPNPDGKSDAPLYEDLDEDTMYEDETLLRPIDTREGRRRPWMHDSFFILIDEEVVQALADADPTKLLNTDEGYSENTRAFWVKVVGIYVEESENEEVEDEGWMKCSIYSIWNFWKAMCIKPALGTWSSMNCGHPYTG